MMYMKAKSIALLLVMASVSCAAWAEVDVSIDVGLRSEENIGLGPSEDEVDDLTTSVAVEVGWNFVQTATTEIRAGVGAYYDRVDDISDLSRNGFTVSASYRGQATNDLTSIFWLLDGEYKDLNYKDSDIRDGSEYEINASIGKRFNELFTLQAGYRYKSRDSDDNSPDRQPAGWWATDVFDMEISGGFLRGEFDVTPDTVVFAEYSRMSGDVASTGLGVNFINGGAFDRAWDYPFGPGQIVWKIDADQDIFDLGVSHQFTEQIGLQFTASFLDADGEQGNDYENTVFTLDLSFNF